MAFQDDDDKAEWTAWVQAALDRSRAAEDRLKWPESEAEAERLRAHALGVEL